MTVETAQMPIVTWRDRTAFSHIAVRKECRADVRQAVISFLDMAGTATGQATFYNSRNDQLKAMDAIHTAVYGANRGLYALMLCLPGVTDLSIQKGVSNLLSKSSDLSNLLTPEQEQLVMSHLTSQLPPQRVFKTMLMVRDAGANSQRVRKYIKRNILGAENLLYWAIKYRPKVREALRHAWGKERTGAIKAILCKQAPTDKEKGLLRDEIDRYLHPSMASRLDEVHETLCYVFGGHRDWKSRLVKMVHEARNDITKGKGLPFEVLEGIRGRFFDFRKTKNLPDGFDQAGRQTIDKAQILELTKATMTTGQKTTLQRAAKKANVEIEFDPSREELSRLYVYALTEGMTPQVREAIVAKAKQIGLTFPLRYAKVAIVVDTSRSMYGTDAQKYRPLAIAMAMRDVLSASATDKATVFATNGSFDENGLVVPGGATDLASAVIDAMKTKSDAIFLITDGYENAPAGRTDEVIRAARKLGIETPIYQISPVMGSESAGVRKISSEVAPMPVSKPEGLALTMVRAALNQDIEQGILSLVNMTLPRLEARHG